MSRGLLEEAVCELLFKERFYGELIMGMVVRETIKDCPTISVHIDEQVHLTVNPFFWHLFDYESQMWFLKHECHHVMGNHFERLEIEDPEAYKKLTDKNVPFIERLKAQMKARSINIAQDLAINEYLPGLPKEHPMVDENGELIRDKEGIPVKASGCFLKNFKKELKDLKKQGAELKFNPDNIKKEMNWEYYYSFLKQAQEAASNAGINKPVKVSIFEDGDTNNPFNMGTTDDHSAWSKNDPNPEYVKEKIKQLVNGAVDRCNGIGNIPDNCVELVNALNHTPRNWKQDIRKFPNMCAESLQEPSIKKRNRRFGFLQPGIRIAQGCHMVCILDDSGSMTTEVLEQCAAEFHGMEKAGAEVTIVVCDAEVQDTYRFDPNKMKSIKCSGRGGTCMKPAFDHINTKEFINKFGRFDGIICLTDGGIFDLGDIQKPKQKVLWAITEPGFSKPWGMQTTIEIKRKS